MRERIPVLKLNNKGVVLSGVAHDGSVHFKPPWGGRPFPTEHQKEGATLFVKGRVHLVLLLESACVLRVEVIQRLCKPKLGRLSSKYAIDKASMMNKRKKKGVASHKRSTKKNTKQTDTRTIPVDFGSDWSEDVICLQAFGLQMVEKTLVH